MRLLMMVWEFEFKYEYAAIIDIPGTSLSYVFSPFSTLLQIFHVC